MKFERYMDESFAPRNIALIDGKPKKMQDRHKRRWRKTTEGGPSLNRSMVIVQKTGMMKNEREEREIERDRQTESERPREGGRE